MTKQTVIAGAILVGGFALAALVLNESTPVSEPGAGPEDPAVYFDATAATEERIRALEVAVGEERNARQLLEEELRFILEELDRMEDGDSEQVEEREAPNRRDQISNEASVGMAEFQRRRSDRNSPEGRTKILLDAGFSPDRAAVIVQRESELQMQAMQARYDARQSGEGFDPNDIRLNPDSALRAEIGDSEYESYLQANGRSTSVTISSVMQTSPAQNAGLKPGDDIVAYGGERVFSTSDLNAQTMQGAPGESVLVDIERDGVPMQIVLPRGPIGITSGRR
jgi:C-terminal processing protease CtpA/Prc